MTDDVEFERDDIDKLEAIVAEHRDALVERMMDVFQINRLRHCVLGWRC